MAVYDLIVDQDEAKSHEHTFLLWPKLWQEYAETHGFIFTWKECQFLSSEIDNIPNEPGLYTFTIQPRVANHPSCSYLMYIGKTKRTLRQRFREYLREKQRESGRPKVIRLLNKYPSNTFFCYTVAQVDSPLSDMEKALLGAFIPPCNKEQLPARVRRIVEALR